MKLLRPYLSERRSVHARSERCFVFCFVFFAISIRSKSHMATKTFGKNVNGVKKAKKFGTCSKFEGVKKKKTVSECLFNCFEWTRTKEKKKVSCKCHHFTPSDAKSGFSQLLQQKSRYCENEIVCLSWEINFDLVSVNPSHQFSLAMVQINFASELEPIVADFWGRGRVHIGLFNSSLSMSYVLKTRWKKTLKEFPPSLKSLLL